MVKNVVFEKPTKSGLKLNAVDCELGTRIEQAGLKNSIARLIYGMLVRKQLPAAGASIKESIMAKFGNTRL